MCRPLRNNRSWGQVHLIRMRDFIGVFRSLVLSAFDAILALLLPFLWVIRKLVFLFGHQRRVSIWTGAPIITVAKNCKAERLIGFNSVSIVHSGYYIIYEFDWVLSRIVGNNRFFATIISYVAFAVACVVTEQVHAFADGGMLPSRRRRNFNKTELFCYRVLGVRLLIWTYGGDVRTRNRSLAFGEPNCCSMCDQVGKACICNDREWRLNFDLVSQGATGIFSMGDMVEYTPGSRNDLFFWPVDLDKDGGIRYRPVFPEASFERPLRVVHAPNHRQFKGTFYLEEAVTKLRSDGLNIELVLVERVPNEQALEIYRSADLVFDQCLIGFHGYFALEAMALGKPVMCVIRDPELYLLSADECPIINTHISTLCEDLKRVVERQDELYEIGRQSRQYIEKHFSLEAFAKRLSKAYEELGIIK